MMLKYSVTIRKMYGQTRRLWWPWQGWWKFAFLDWHWQPALGPGASPDAVNKVTWDLRSPNRLMPSANKHLMHLTTSHTLLVLHTRLERILSKTIAEHLLKKDQGWFFMHLHFFMHLKYNLHTILGKFYDIS